MRAPSVNITYVDYVGPKMAKTNILSVPLSEVDFLDHSFMALSIIVCTFSGVDCVSHCQHRYR